MPRGVGVIGAGPGVSALHLPTLARLPDHFRVVHVSDGGSGRAADLAARTAARSSSHTAELLADPEVEVVALCSPPAGHAEIIRAAVAAGKRAILCEKPIATTRPDADAVIEACRAAGTTLVVGTNHLYDAAWGRAKHYLTAMGGRVRTVSVTVSLPPNGRYHELVTDAATTGAARPPGPGPDFGNPEVAASVVRQLLTGLAIHDIPLLRDVAPRFDRVEFARAIPPIGYLVGYSAGDVLVRLAAVMHGGGADTLWRLSISTDNDRVDVDFPPPFVHAGSASVRVRADEGRWTTHAGEASDGYEDEWRSLAAILDDGVPTEYDELLADAHYAIDIADAAAALIRTGEGS
ncbi:Gfo/Idh/MocA family protein [Microbacterium sp. P02]|uniref:Gfo/Idh/MocA family protein n=1 Tax=Microbacterium sp. P02 TaxID=3366260 RepID=UPI00367176E6